MDKGIKPLRHERKENGMIGEFDDYVEPEFPEGATEEELERMRREAKEYNEELRKRLREKYRKD